MPDGLDADTRPLQAIGASSGDGWVLGGRYRVIQRVGTGGMAEVFRAHDELLDRDVAVKVFRTLFGDPDGSANGATRRDLELQAMARLNHPNLVTLFDGSVSGDGPSYLVLEFVDGPDLASRLKDGPLPEPQVRELGAQIGDALAYVHAHGLVHRDVKPANILLGTEHGFPGRFRARLSDFGIVRMVGQPHVTSADLTIGTAYYIAPEQARGSNVGPEADVYALGLVLVEALTGARAFDGPMHEALAARLTAAPQVPADLPAPWPTLLPAMTAHDPAARPDAAAVARELQAAVTTGALAGLATAPVRVGAVAPATSGAGAAFPADSGTAAALAAPAVAAAEAGRPRRRLHPGLLVAAILVAAAVALGAFLFSVDPSGSPAGTEPTVSPAQQRSSSSSSSSEHRPTSSAANVGNAPTKDRSSTKPAKKERSTAQTSQTSRTSRPVAPVEEQTTTTSAPPSSSSPAPSSSASASSPSGDATTSDEAVPVDDPTSSVPGP